MNKTQDELIALGKNIFGEFSEDDQNELMTGMGIDTIDDNIYAATGMMAIRMDEINSMDISDEEKEKMMDDLQNGELS